MPNEFVARNGIIALNNSTITGSLNVSGNITTPGSITATTLVVQTITSSINFVTGSTKSGLLTSNTHQFTGSVSASGSLAINTNVLYVDGTNVGIGTTTAQNLLHVRSGASGLSSYDSRYKVVLENNGEAYYAITVPDNSYAGFRILGTSSSPKGAVEYYMTDNLLHVYATGSIRFYNGAAESMRILAGGSVGIGTSSPAAKLDVNGSLFSHDYFRVYAGAGNVVAVTTWSSTDSGFMNLYTGGSTAVQLHSNGASYFNGGNIGIGTTSPSVNLDVRSIDTSTPSFISTGNSDISNFISIYGGRSGDAISAIWWKNGQSLKLGTATSNNGASESIKITITDSGNVGIATTSPTALLHVQGLAASPNTDSVYITNKRGGYFPLRVLVTQGDYQGVLIEHQDGDGSGGPGPSGSYGFKFDDKRTQNTYSSHPSASFVIARSNTYNNTNIFEVRPYNSVPAIAVATGGNVGIGTSSPTDELQVVASTYNGITITTNDVATLKMRSTGGTKNWGFATTNLAASDFGIYQSTSGGGDPISAGTAKLYFDGSGNVGIGTTSPSSILHILDTSANDTTLIIGQAGEVPVIKAGGANTDLQIEAVGAGGYLNFVTNGNSRMLIGGGGNVGIGTTSPANNLHVYSGTSFILIESTSSGANANLRLKTTARTWSLGPNQYLSNSNFEIVDSTAGTTRITIDSEGNVGIGTSSPSTKLHIVGTGRLTSTLIIGAGSSATSQLDVTSDGSANGITLRNRTEDDYAFLNWRNNNGTELLAETYVQRTASNTATLRHTINNGGSPVTYLTIASTGIATFANNVVISGTGNPALDVAGTAIIRGNGSTYNTHYFTTGAANVAKYMQYNASGTIINQIAADTVSYINGGNLGIGTTSPQRKLVVSGDTNISGSLVMGGLVDSGGLGTGVIYMLEGQGIAWYNSAFNAGRASIQGTSAGHIILAPTANVGIGTTSPVGKLDVRAGSGGKIILGTYDANYNLTVEGGDQFNAYNGGSTTAMYIQYAGGNTILNGAGTGNVGVGVVSPTNKFQIGSTSYNGNDLAIGNGSVNFAIDLTSSNTDIYSSGAMTFNTALTERVRIKADGNVGIGTTDPNTLLVVRKAVNDEWIAKFINTGTNPYGMYVDTSANTSGAYTFAAYTYAGLGLFVINNTGNVGIGTSAPNAKLHVAGLVNIYPASTDGELNISQAASSGGTTTVVLRSNGGSYFNGGNVGIGITSPSYKLSVSETISANGNNILLGADGTYAGYSAVSFGGSLANGAAKIFARNNGIDALYVCGPTSYGVTIRVNGTSESAKFYGSGNVAVGMQSKSLVVGADSDSPNATLDVRGNMYMTSTSTQPVLIYGDSGASNGLFRIQIDEVSDSFGTGTRTFLGDGGNDIFIGTGNSSYTPANTYIALNQSGEISMGAGSATKHLVINTSGNVGIGSTSPAYKLDVRSGAVYVAGGGFSGPESETGYRVKMYDNGGVHNDPGIGLDGAGGAGEIMWFNAYNGFYFNLGTQGVKVKIDASGNVGIGTTSPQGGALHLFGSTAVFEGPSSGNTGINSNVYALQVGPRHDRSTTANTYYPGIAFNHLLNYSGGTSYNGSPQAWIGTRLGDTAGSERDYLVFATKPGTLTSDIPTERMCISPYDGNIGIGTTSPGWKLHIEGTTGTSIQDPLLALKVTTANNTSGILFINSGNASSFNDLGGIYARIYSGNAKGYLGFYTRNSDGDNSDVAERMRIISDGNVGINSTSPGYKLDVNGTARFGAVIVGSLGTGTVYSNGGTLTNTNPSDRNLKENIAPINYGLNEILQLDPVTFNWKDDININKQFGFIAQDVQEVMPDAVVEGEYLGLEKDAIYTALINAIKELKAEIDELKNK